MPVPSQELHRPAGDSEDMTHIKRSRRLQAGLAGLSVVSALGAAVGLGLTTQTGSSTASQATGGTSSSHKSGEGDDNSRANTTSSSTGKQQSSPVTKPSTTTPQATTSGS